MTVGRCPLGAHPKGHLPRVIYHQVILCTPLYLISQRVFMESFCKSQFPHKPFNLFSLCTPIVPVASGEGTTYWVYCFCNENGSSQGQIVASLLGRGSAVLSDRKCLYSCFAKPSSPTNPSTYCFILLLKRIN